MKYLKLFLFNLLLLFFLLGAVEFYLEKTTRDDSHFTVPSRYIRLREFALPGKSATVSPSPTLMRSLSENLEFKTYAVATDPLGFIQSVPPPGSPKIKIVFFGGSTTECQFVDDSLRFPSLVGKKFRQTGKSVGTFNSGVSGNQTLHSINLLVNKVMRRDFQVAVMMHNINDLVHLLYNGSYYNEQKTPTRRNLAVLSVPDEGDHDLGFFRHFGAGMRAKKSFQVLFPLVYEKLHFARKKVVSAAPLLEFNNWEIFQPLGEEQFSQFQKNLETFTAICRANGIEPVLMTQFNRITPEEFQNPIFGNYVEKMNRGPVSAEMFFGYYRRFNEIIREVAKAQGVLLIDLDKQVPKNKEQMYDMVHLHNQGSRFVAEVVFRELEAHLFPPASN